MAHPAIQSRCAACEVTFAQLARANSIVKTTQAKQGLSSPGKPYPIPPTSGTDSHPYGKQIGNTEFIIAPELEVPQTKVWIQPQYHVVRKYVDLDAVKGLVASIYPPGSQTLEADPKPGPNVPRPPNAPRFKTSDAADPMPKPNVPLPPSAPRRP